MSALPNFPILHALKKTAITNIEDHTDMKLNQLKFPILEIRVKNFSY